MLQGGTFSCPWPTPVRNTEGRPPLGKRHRAGRASPGLRTLSDHDGWRKNPGRCLSRWPHVEMPRTCQWLPGDRPMVADLALPRGAELVSSEQIRCRGPTSSGPDQKEPPGTSLAVQCLRFRLPMQGVWVRSLVGELRSHMPRSQKTKI